DEMLAQKIGRLFNESRRTYGWRRIGQMLAREGIRCGKERILRLMKRQGLGPIQKRRSRPKTTQSRHDQPIAINRSKTRRGSLAGPMRSGVAISPISRPWKKVGSIWRDSST